MTSAWFEANRDLKTSSEERGEDEDEDEDEDGRE